MGQKNILKFVGASFVPILFFGIFFPMHMFNVLVHDQSNWKGGGMGMFSGFEHHTKRHVAYYFVTHEGQRIRTNIDHRVIHELEARFELLPTHNNAQKIIDAARNTPMEIVYQTGNFMTLRVATEFSQQELFDYADGSFVIELWKMDYVERSEDAITTNIRNAAIYYLN